VKGIKKLHSYHITEDLIIQFCLFAALGRRITQGIAPHLQRVGWVDKHSIRSRPSWVYQPSLHRLSGRSVSEQ
jgi:hypothetical protein